MAEHPGIVFKDGPSGRRAALNFGPDIWEVTKYLNEIDERGESAVSAAAEVFAQPLSKIRLALDYYATYREELTAEIAEADDASTAAEAGWHAQRQLLA